MMEATSLFITRTASYSPCKKYRYTLQIIWNHDLPMATVIGLNPSTATEFQDDPTIRRCVGFAERWSCGGLMMLNIFSWRDTEPKNMMKATDPIGLGTDEILVRHAMRAQERTEQERRLWPCVAAWGTHGRFMARGKQVSKMLDGRLQCLRISKDGAPCHPLYLPYGLPLVPYGGER